MNYISRQRIAICLCFLVLPLLSHAQERRGRNIEKLAGPNEPAELTDVQVNDPQNGKRSVRLGEIVVGDENWLKGLNLKVKNKSDKPFVYMEVYVYVPASEQTLDQSVRILLQYGRIPSPSGEVDLSAPTEAKPISPSNEVVFALSDEDYERYKSLIREKHGRNTFDKVKIRIGMIVFEDGTAWKNGQLLRRDPNNPQTWRAVDSISTTTPKFNSYPKVVFSGGDSLILSPKLIKPVA